MKKIFAILLFCIPFGHLAFGQNTLSEKPSVATRVVVLPPYPLSFHELMIKQGNAVILQNQSPLPQRISLTMSLNSLDGNVSIATNRPVLSLELTPFSTQTIPLSQLLGGLTPGNLILAGISPDAISSNRSLPEGYYTLCVTPRSYYTNGIIGQEGCSATIPVMAIEPPTLRLANPILNDTVLNTFPQNLLFQWNSPFGMSSSLMGNVKTTLKIMEVPNGMTPTQAILSAPISTPQFTITGQHQFLYGPTYSPLIKGRRYAAVLQLSDPYNSVIFRNNGVSEVLSFVYGQQPINALSKNSSIITGSVLWAYKAVEESANNKELPLVSKNAITERRQEIIKDNKVGKQTFPLENALVSVYGSNTTNNIRGFESVKVPIGTAKTDVMGRYTLDLVLENAMKKFQYITFEVNHPSGLFNKQIMSVTYQSLLAGANMQPIVLAGQTLELTPRVQLLDGSLNKDVSIQILLPEKQWSKYAVLEGAGLGSTNKTINYNNQTYRIVASITNGNTFNRLFQTVSPNEHYVVKVNGSNKQSAFYPLDAVFLETFDKYGEKPIIEIEKNFVFDNTHKLSGKVLINGNTRANVRIVATINAADILGISETKKSFSVITDNEGNYTITGIPDIKVGSAINFQLVDKTISNNTFNEVLQIRKNESFIKDFKLTISKKTITGQLVDAKGNSIGNALVMVKNGSKAVRSDESGNYSVEVDATELTNELQFMADGFRDTLVTIQTGKAISKQKKTELSNIINQGKTVLNPYLSNASVVINVIKLADNSNLRDGILTIESQKGLFKPAKFDLTTIDSKGVNFNFGQQYDDAGYKITYTASTANKLSLATESIPFTLPRNSANRSITLGVSTTKAIAGIVKKDLASGAPITQQTVSLVNSTYQAISDKSGRFQMVVPLNQTVRIQASRTGFLAYDSVFSGLNDTVILRSNISQTFKTVLGFPASITFIKELSAGSSYLISGYITVPNNNIFSITSSNNLYFNNVTVSVDKQTNAILPTGTASIPLTTASLQLNAFGFAPVQVTNLTLKPISGNTTTGQLCGKMILYPSAPANATIALPNATLIDVAAKTDSMNTAFAISTTSTLTNNSYRLYFKSSGYIGVDMTNLNSTLNFDTATLSSSGINNLHGYLQLNSIVGFTPSNSGKINIQSGSFGTDFGFKTLSFNVGSTTILSGSLQKLKSDFNDIQIAGLNTTNATLLFGGNLTIAKGISSAPFTSMGLVKTINGLYAFSSAVNLTNTFTINSFTFKPVSNSSASFSYSTQNKTYNLSLPVGINGSSINSSVAAVKTITNAVFVNDITAQFNMQSSNWSVFVAPNANQAVDLGLATINIGTFLISIGNNPSINTMDSMMLGTKATSLPTNNDTTLINATTSDWAYGISGSVSFPLVKSLTGKGLNNGGGGILLFSNTAQYGLQARVDTLYMNISTGIMVATAGGTMTFDNDKKGFALSASVVVYNVSPEYSLDKKGVVYKGFAASYKYYQYSSGGIELGASILVQTDIRVGPVTFHSIGGGFDFNTQSGQYNVFVNGDLGPTGVPAVLVDVPVALNILFSSSCNYLPIITGSGSEVIGTVLKVSNSNVILDLCNKYLMATVSQDLNLPSPLSLVKMSRSGTMFIAIPSKNSPNGCFYLEMDINMNIPYLLQNAAAGMAIGYNVASNNEYIPASAMKRLSSFVGSGTLNGLFVYGDLAQSTSGIYKFNFLGVRSYLGWNESINYGLTFFTNLSGDITVNLSSNFKAHVGGRLGVNFYGFGASLGGSLDVGTTLNGAYSPSAGFNIAGSGSAQFQVFGGGSNAENIGCNSVKITYSSYTIHTALGSVSTDYPDGIEAKACIGMGLSFGIKSGKAPYVNLNF